MLFKISAGLEVFFDQYFPASHSRKRLRTESNVFIITYDGIGQSQLFGPIRFVIILSLFEAIWINLLLILPMDSDLLSDQATVLCTSCGLCCTGHLFAWVKLKPSELDAAEALGMTVFRSNPTERGFSLPCQLWKGQCTIHHSAHYPRVCRAYQCKLLKDLLGEKTSLPEALTVVDQAKHMIQEVEALLPVSSNPNFRERLVAHIEHPEDITGQEEMLIGNFRRNLMNCFSPLRSFSEW